MEIWAPAEFTGAQLWDTRCNKSLARMAGRIAEHTHLSYSEAVGSAGRQSGHNIFGHPRTTVDKLLLGHREQTVERCSEYDLILASQDTTTLDYTSHLATVGLGPINTSSLSRGLLSHSVLAMSPEGLPLGVLHLDLWAREIAESGKEPPLTGKERRRKNKNQSIEHKESGKWLKGLRGVEAAFKGKLRTNQRVLLIQDREADIFEFIAAKRMPGIELLIRANHPRTVEVVGEIDREKEDGERDKPKPFSAEPPTIGKLYDVVAQGPVVGTMQATIPRRPGQSERVAVLTLQVSSVWMMHSDDLTLIKRKKAVEQALSAPTEHNHSKRKRYSKIKIAQSSDLKIPEEPLPPMPAAVTASNGAPSNGNELKGAKQVWVIRAVEKEPPAGVKAIEWVLLSTMEVTTEEQARKMVGYYLCRWIIERLHFTLKSGMNVEKLQMEAAHPLKNAIGFYYVVAWRLLWLVYHARLTPEMPAEMTMTRDELDVLEATVNKRIHTARDVVRAIGKLGGHPGNPSAGEPGVKTMWTGLQMLQQRLIGYQMGRKIPTAT